MSQGVSNQCWLAHPRVGRGAGSPGCEEKGVGPGIEITVECVSQEAAWGSWKVKL